MVMKALPSDPTQCYKERSELASVYFEAMELAADMESFYLQKKMTEHEAILQGGYPKSAAMEYAKTRASEERRYMLKAQAAVQAINDRSIKLSQNLKLREG